MKLTVFSQAFAIKGSFTISRGSKTQINPVICQIEQDGIIGQGECIPYHHYSETVEGVIEAIQAIELHVSQGLDRKKLQQILPAGAARNAVDCALWDLECKTQASSPLSTAFTKIDDKLITAYTLSVASPDEMRKKAAENSHRKLLKLKLAGDGDDERMQAVREAAPQSQLIVDANEAWSEYLLERNLKAALDNNIAMIEQPLPAERDQILAEIPHSVPIFADESIHTKEHLLALKDRYDGINIKLDKAGGLTEAILLKQAAQDIGFEIMVGCMLGTSLSMAPAYYLASDAKFVDLDGPLLLQEDCNNGIFYDENYIYRPNAKLWG